MRSRSSCAARTGQRRRGVDNYHAARGTVAAAPARRCGRSVRDKFSLPGAAGTVTRHTGPGQVETARRVQDKWRRRQRIIALPPHARRVPGRRARAGRMRHVLAVRSHRPCAARPRLRPPLPARRHPKHRGNLSAMISTHSPPFHSMQAIRAGVLIPFALGRRAAGGAAGSCSRHGDAGGARGVGEWAPRAAPERGASMRVTAWRKLL